MRVVNPTELVSITLLLLCVCHLTMVDASCKEGTALRFKPAADGPPYSFHDKVTAALGETISPIIVQVLDSDGKVSRGIAMDITASLVSTSTTASVNPKAMPAVTVAVVRGEARFDTIKIVSDPGTTVTLSFRPSLTTAAAISTPLSLAPRSGRKMLRFASYDSFFVAQDSTMQEVTVGHTLPKIRVVVHEQWGGVVTDTTGEVCAESVINNIIQAAEMQNNRAPVVQGIATFTEATLVKLLSSRPEATLRFTLLETGKSNVTLDAPNVKLRLMPVTTTRLGFGDIGNSFLYRELEKTTAAGGQALPDIEVYVVDSAGNRDGSGHGLVIRATSSLGHPLEHAEAAVIDGRAIFSALTIKDVTATAEITLLFEAVDTHLLDFKLWSPRIRVVSSATTATDVDFFMDRYYSFLSYRGQVRTAVVGYPLSMVALELITDGHIRHTASNNIDMSVTSSVSGGLTKDLTVTFTSGAAIVNGIVPVKPGRMALYFNITTAGTTVSGKSTYVYLDVLEKVVPATYLTFEFNTHTVVSPTHTRHHATIGEPIPPVSVLMLDSAHNFDPTATGIAITATAPDAYLDNARILMLRGQALFSRLVVVSSKRSAVYITFTAENNGHDAVAGKSIVMGVVNIVSANKPAYALHFNSHSFLRYDNEIIIAGVGKSLPDVRLVVKDSNLRTSNVFTGKGVVKYGDTTQIGTFEVKNGHATASNLVIPKTANFFDELSFCLTEYALEPSLPCVSSGPVVLGGTQSAAKNVFFVNITQPDVLRESPNKTLDFYVQLYRHDSTTVYPTDWVVSVHSGEAIVNDTLALSASGPTRVPVNFSSLPWLVGFTPKITFTVGPRNPRDVDEYVLGLVERSVVSEPVVRIPVNESSLPVTVLETYMDYTTFINGGNRTWLADLQAMTRLSRQRFDVMRVAHGGAYLTAAETLKWKGTRVELKVLYPRVDSWNYALPGAVVDSLLNLKISSAPQLELRRVVSLADDKVCDLYRFQQMFDASARCIATDADRTVRESRCWCFEGFFRVLGDPCVRYSKMSDACTLVDPCMSAYPHMESICKEVAGDSLVLILIFCGFFLLGVSALAILVGWKSGYFERRKAPRLGGQAVKELDEVEQDHKYAML